jgi:RES domain-containing protein
MAGMKIWRLCREVYAADAFTGEGSRLFGGRWNSRGVPMVYASTSLALAAIELFVHVEPQQMPTDLVAIQATLPEDETILRWEGDALPANWWSDELGPMRELGDAWMRSRQSLAVLVPSVPIRQEWNVLLNPQHPRMVEIQIGIPQPFTFDARMFATR